MSMPRKAINCTYSVGGDNNAPISLQRVVYLAKLLPVLIGRRSDVGQHLERSLLEQSLRLLSPLVDQRVRHCNDVQSLVEVLEVLGQAGRS